VRWELPIEKKQVPRLEIRSRANESAAPPE
jgi:hypothetical protein